MDVRIPGPIFLPHSELELVSEALSRIGNWLPDCRLSNRHPVANSHEIISQKTANKHLEPILESILTEISQILSIPSIDTRVNDLVKIKNVPREDGQVIGQTGTPRTNPVNPVHGVVPGPGYKLVSPVDALRHPQWRGSRYFSVPCRV